MFSKCIYSSWSSSGGDAVEVRSLSLALRLELVPAEDVPTDFVLSRVNDPNPYTFPFFTLLQMPATQSISPLDCDISIAGDVPL
ncbi:hypothetical protein NL676_038201 [Syzygium grande]|nr:hypothetical protein NL676_038201 [Syzygium grande]